MPVTAGSRRQHAEERREQILDAALRVFAEKGFAGAAVRDIAREAGITEGLIYHYFESKDRLIHACFTERSWRPKIERILADKADAPVAAVLEALLTDFLATMRAHGPLVRMCAAEMQRNAEVAQAHLARIEENQKLIDTFLHARQAAGELRSDLNVQTAAGLLLGCGHSLFLLLGQADQDVWDRVAADFVRNAVTVVMHGIARPAVQPEPPSIAAEPPSG